MMITLNSCNLHESTKCIFQLKMSRRNTPRSGRFISKLRSQCVKFFVHSTGMLLVDMSCTDIPRQCLSCLSCCTMASVRPFIGKRKISHNRDFKGPLALSSL